MFLVGLIKLCQNCPASSANARRQKFCVMFKYGIMSDSFEGMPAAPVMPWGPQLCSGAAPEKADYKGITRASLWEISWLGCCAQILLVMPASMAIPRIRVFSWVGVFSNQVKLLSLWESRNVYENSPM